MILAPLIRLYRSLFTANIINLSTNAYIVAQYEHDTRWPCSLCNTEPANLTSPDMPANNVTRRRNTIARQDRLEREARTQALARREVGLSANDHCHNAASSSHAPHYHRRPSSPLPRLGYPYTRMASNRHPRSPSPSPWGDPEGQAARQREMEEQWLLPLGRGLPPQSQRELTDAKYDQLWDNNCPQPATGNSTEAVEALPHARRPPLVDSRRPAIPRPVPCLRPRLPCPRPHAHH